MALKLRKVAPQRLRVLGLDESWLQDQLAREPALLGLGDLHLIQREKSQPSGGRIDLLLYDPDEETRYEVEVMLGAVDESHIIRTIEYWDVERQRYPTMDHRAVIVAEEITGRFFNVIRLLNRAIPISAIQLSAFQFDDEVVLQFTRVLDTYEFGADAAEEDERSEPADRGFWEKKSSPDSLKVVEGVRALLPAPERARVAYNKFHIALGTTGYNFAWFHPRREAAHCHIQLKASPDTRQKTIEDLENAGVDAKGRGRTHIVLRLRPQDIQEHRAAIAAALAEAERISEK